MSLRTVQAVRYITPLREGGSMPALVEADDGRQYVVKLRGAGQGTLALVAEVIAGELARALGLRVPELVYVELDAQFGRAERDPEIRDLLRASTGTNLGLAFLAGSTTFDPAAGDVVNKETASLIVWLDAFVMNVDRTSRNANLLAWEGGVWLIDHGAALYFHHNWPTAREKQTSGFALIREHVLLPQAGGIETASERAHGAISRDLLTRIVGLVPDDWLAVSREAASLDELRSQYVDFLLTRLAGSAIFEEEVRRGRKDSV